MAVAGLFYTYHSHLDGCPREIILAAWAVLPPLWLIVEYWLLFDRNRESPLEFEAFRHSQALARNLWIGFLAFLAAFYLGSWGGDNPILIRKGRPRAGSEGSLVFRWTQFLLDGL